MVIMLSSCGADEQDPSVPKPEPPSSSKPTPSAQQGTDLPDQAKHSEGKQPAAPADSPPLHSFSADSAAAASCAEKVAELSLEESPAAAPSPKAKGEDSTEEMSVLKALSLRELQAYGPETNMGYNSNQLCEDVEDLDICDDTDADAFSDTDSVGSEKVASDACSEEQEDFQAAKLTEGAEASSQGATVDKLQAEEEDAKLVDGWVDLAYEFEVI